MIWCQILDGHLEEAEHQLEFLKEVQQSLGKSKVRALWGPRLPWDPAPATPPPFSHPQLPLDFRCSLAVRLCLVGTASKTRACSYRCWFSSKPSWHPRSIEGSRRPRRC